MTRRRTLAAGLAVAVVVVALAGYLVLQKPKAHPPAVAARPTPIISPAFPDLPAGRDGYRVVSADLKIDLTVVEGDGWTVPYNRAAHYPGMAWPGDGGRSMLYAHALPGMFGPLSQARVGQRIDVTRAGKPTVHYVIKQYFPKWSPGDLTYVRPSAHEELVLLTCTSYQANDPRIIAVAEPV